MKKIIVLLISVSFFLLFNACDFEFVSIDRLMRPPMTATERELDSSIRKLLGNDISLRSPEYGSNHSAITLHDIDGDSVDEAIVFYTNPNATSVVRMSVMKKTDKGWAIVSDFAGNGSGVYSLGFEDLNNDSCDDMLVSWYLFEDKVNKTLTIYSCSRVDGDVSFSACSTETYNIMHIDDVIGTGEKQILLAFTDNTMFGNKSNVRLLSLSEDNRVVQLCNKSLDSRILEMISVQTDRNENNFVRVFIDAEISGEKNVTEVLSWDSENENFVSLIPQNDKGLSNLTVRSNSFYVQDIDNDGLLEIPLKEPLSESADSDSSVGYLLVWNSLSEGKLKVKEQYIVNLQGNYRLLFPHKYTEKVLVKSDNTTGHWKFLGTDGKTELFDIVIYDINEWEKQSNKVTAMLHTNNNKVYACNITEAGRKLGISADELIESFSMNT